MEEAGLVMIDVAMDGLDVDDEEVLSVVRVDPIVENEKEGSEEKLRLPLEEDAESVVTLETEEEGGVASDELEEAVGEASPPYTHPVPRGIDGP